MIHALPLLPILFHWRVWTLPVASGGEEDRRPTADTSAVYFPLALENLIETRVAEDQTHYTGGGGRWYGAETRLILSVLSGVSRWSCPLLNLLVWEQAGTLGTDITGVTDGVSDGSASPERSSPPRAGRSGTSEVAWSLINNADGLIVACRLSCWLESYGVFPVHRNLNFNILVSTDSVSSLVYLFGVLCPRNELLL